MAKQINGREFREQLKAEGKSPTRKITEENFYPSYIFAVRGSKK